MLSDMETELKLSLLQPVEPAEKLQEFLGLKINGVGLLSWSIIDMEAWYYDTADHSLQKAGIAYRVRREGECWTATIKTKGDSGGGLHQRKEWNAASPDQQPRPDLFLELPIGAKMFEVIGDQPLVPLFATVFERRTADVQYEDAYIELAIDTGTIVAGEKREPINELELELKDGAKIALLRLGALIAHQLQVVPESKSKYYRALTLAGLAGPQTKEPLALSPQEALPDGLSVLMTDRVCKLFAAYQSYKHKPDAPESIHRLRVKLRRLRSVLLFAKPCIAEEEYQVWRVFFKELSGLFGPVRDLDVLAAEWETLCSSPYITFDSKPWLGDNISKRRIALLEQMADKLDQYNVCARLMEFWAWVESRPWQPHSDSIGAYARWRIGGWIAALIDAGKTTDWDNDQELHALRLRLKRIRYTLAVMPFYSDRRTEKLLIRAKNTHVLLGVLNDRAVSGKTLSTLARGATRAVYRDIGIFSGWQGKSEEIARGQLRGRWKELRQAAKRWLEV